MTKPKFVIEHDTLLTKDVVQAIAAGRHNHDHIDTNDRDRLWLVLTPPGPNRKWILTTDRAAVQQGFMGKKIWEKCVAVVAAGLDEEVHVVINPRSFLKLDPVHHPETIEAAAPITLPSGPVVTPPTIRPATASTIPPPSEATIALALKAPIMMKEIVYDDEPANRLPETNLGLDKI